MSSLAGLLLLLLFLFLLLLLLLLFLFFPFFFTRAEVAAVASSFRLRFAAPGPRRGFKKKDISIKSFFFQRKKNRRRRFFTGLILCFRFLLVLFSSSGRRSHGGTLEISAALPPLHYRAPFVGGGGV